MSERDRTTIDDRTRIQSRFYLMHGHAQGIEISVEQRPEMTIETAVFLGVAIVEIDTAGLANV